MVNKIRELCKKNGTSIYKLEKQLGFGNGVIGRWDTSIPSYERLTAVATALGVPVTELTGETATAAKKEPAPLDELLPGYARLTEENKLKANFSIDSRSITQLLTHYCTFLATFTRIKLHNVSQVLSSY